MIGLFGSFKTGDFKNVSEIYWLKIFSAISNQLEISHFSGHFSNVLTMEEKLKINLKSKMTHLNISLNHSNERTFI